MRPDAPVRSKPTFPLLLLDVGWLTLILVYLLAGRALVPLHGDETSYALMSRDWYLFAVNPDLHKLYFSPDQADDPIQSHRLTNAPLSRYSLGIAFQIAGLSVEELPDSQWNWVWTWEQNQAAGNIPSDELIRIARLPATIGLWLGVIGIFCLGLLLGGREPAYISSGLMALNPIILLHGRRAMAEGLMLGFSTLAIVTGAIYLTKPEKFEPWYKRVGWLALTGILVGLSFSTKHNSAIVGIVLGGVIGIVQILNRLKSNWLKGLWSAIWQVGLIALVALGLSFALAPAFWHDPTTSIATAWEHRNRLAHEHAAAWGGYLTSSERLKGMVEQLFWAPPSYYEVPQWADYVGADIDRYESSPLSGIPRNPSTAVFFEALFFAGMVALVAWAIDSKTAQHRWLVGLAFFWLITTLGLTYQFILINWQRYYYPALPVVILFQGCGLFAIIRLAIKGANHWILQRRNRSTEDSHQHS